MQNWNRIKQEISLNIGKIFSGTIQPNYTDFDQGLDLFYKVLCVKCNVKALDGLTKTVLPALNSAYVTSKGELNPLKILAEELEPFMKKVCLLIYNRDFSNDYRKSLGPLMEELQLSSIIINRGTVGFSSLFSEANIVNLKGEDGYAEFLGNSYIIRNAVHNSPNWDYIEVFENLRSLLVAYIYPILKYKNELSRAISTLFIDINPTVQEAPDHQEKALYEFISLGGNTFELKKQILKSSILYYLYEKPNAKMEDIHIYCNVRHNSQANFGIYKNIINGLIQEGRLEYTNTAKTEVKLTEIESNRIKNAIDVFEFQNNNFNLMLCQTLQEYNLEAKSVEITNKLKKLFESNYNNDVYEIFNQAYESNNNEQCDLFLTYLNEIIHDKNKTKDLFLDLLIICQENDFLHKTSASAVLSKYIDSTSMQNYLRQQERIVYIDSQILFYAICYYYTENADWKSNVYFNATKELIKYSEFNSNVQLITSQYYVNETTYHLKEALLLIPFEELGFFEAGNSQNVYYKFYKHLEREQLLDYDVNSFADFLYELNLEYEDVFNPNFMITVSKIVTEYLNELGIDVEFAKKCSQGHLAYEVFKNTLTGLGKPRQEVTIENDASMLNLLSENNTGNDYFFTTWDTAFYEARKKYVEKNKAAKHFLLYSPSKLMTTFSLANFEVNPESVTLEFQSILDGEDIQSKTTEMLDILNNLFDIGKEERRKYLSKLKEFKTKYVVDIDSRPEDIHGEERIQPHIALIKDLTYNFNNKKSKYKLDDLKLVFGDDEYFEIVSNLFESELEFYKTKLQFTGTLTQKLFKLISDMKKKKK